jgi:hypothetical protein
MSLVRTVTAGEAIADASDAHRGRLQVEWHEYRVPGTPQNPKSGWGRRTPRAAQSGVLGGIFIHQELHSSYSVPIVLSVKEYNERVQ